MKTIALSLIVLLTALVTRADAFLYPSNGVPTVSLAWNSSPSTNFGVLAYNLYFGVGSQQYTNKMNVGTNLTASVSNLVRGVTYYFSVTATASGLESSFSNEVSYQPPQVPLPPSMKPIVVLQVEYKNDLKDFMWADAPWNFSLTPEQSQAYYRLEIAEVARLFPSRPCG